MGETTEMAVTKDRNAVVESLVLRGDVSGLTPKERTAYYIQMCERLGLDPYTKPFEFLRLNGKEVLYANKGCADQLARIHGVTRRIVDGPKLIDLGGTKLIYCVAEASMPNGRVETSTATLLFTDPAMVLMKAETKAKRRATLGILALGMLDEAEVADIPASAREHLGGPDMSLAETAGDEAEVADEEEPAPRHPLADYAEGLDALKLPSALGDHWLKHRAALNAATEKERADAWAGLIAQALESKAFPSATAAKAWLKKYLAENPQPPSDPAGGGSTPKGSAAKANGRGESTTAASGPTGCVETWMTTMLGIDTYLGQKTLWTLLENAVRKHARAVPEGTLRMYFLRRAIERLQMLSKDALGTVLALDGKGGCRELVMCWADEGPRKEAAQRKAMETLTTAAQLDRQVA